jgi:hypothetical protein
LPRYLCGLLVVLAIALVACSDDGDDSDDSTYTVAFVNDTDAEVSIGLCTATDCTALLSVEDVAAGSTHDVEADVATPVWYAVTDTSSTILGCYELSFTEPPTEGAGFLVSEAGVCP